jgi:transcriptional regulator with XRE-family HTH domain
MRRSTRTYSPLGLLITAEREALGVRVKDFCRLAGISTRTYTNLLFGKMCICRVP